MVFTINLNDGYELSSHPQINSHELILQKLPNFAPQYIQMSLCEDNLYLINSDGKTIIVNDKMNVSRWQNITESIQKARCCGIDA